jgi:hypothetical protein
MMSYKLIKWRGKNWQKSTQKWPVIKLSKIAQKLIFTGGVKMAKIDQIW